MGYRSNGYFIIPAAYSAELERKVDDYLVEEEQQRIKDKKVADEAGKHYLYGNTKPWNPLTGFDFITLMEDSYGNQYHKYGIEGWKWYQGSGFPQIVDELLNFISSKGKLAIFALQGEDWDDTTVNDSTGQIIRVYELAGNPWTGEIPQILVMVDHEGPASDADNYQEVLDKLTALEPTESGNPYATDVYLLSSDDESTTKYINQLPIQEIGGYPMSINSPTMVKRWLVRGAQWFYWDTDNRELFLKIEKILTDFDIEMEDTIGFSVMMDRSGNSEQLEINGTSHWDYDVWLQSGWDDTGLDLVDVKEIPIKDIHKI